MVSFAVLESVAICGKKVKTHGCGLLSPVGRGVLVPIEREVGSSLFLLFGVDHR